MKHPLVLCCLIALIGCGPQDGRLASERPVEQIGTNQLMEAFITYVQKAEGVTLNAREMKQMRNELEMGKTNPLLQPYRMEGEGVGRQLLIREIGEALGKCVAGGMTLSAATRYASDRNHLETLSNAELVVAFRLVEQIAGNVNPRITQ